MPDSSIHYIGGFEMLMKKRSSLVWAFVMGLLLSLLYTLWPVYGFYSHQKGFPHVPFGWQQLPEQAPQEQVIADPNYAQAGTQALQALATHRGLISAPAMTAAVAIDGKQVWAGAVGWSDIESRQAATVDTQFRIGSTSKAINATALARMMQADLINLDQPLNSVFDVVPNPEWAEITPRQLASHMAGLPHYRETKDIAGLYHFMSLRRHYDDVIDATALFDDTPLLSAPGEAFSYSSLGTVLLSAFMQQAGDMPYQQWVGQEVLQPLGMLATTMSGQGDNLATPYWRDEADPKRIRVYRDVDLSHRLAGGGFVSTSADLVRLGSAYFDLGFLRAEIVDQVWQPQELNNGETNKQRYAIGWRKGNYKSNGTGTPTYHHGGVSRGGQSWLIVIPKYKIVIAVNINTKTDTFWDFAQVYRDIATAFIPE
jgi:CubicO group peptidase (beta-lactamase class C family)